MALLRARYFAFQSNIMTSPVVASQIVAKCFARDAGGNAAAASLPSRAMATAILNDIIMTPQCLQVS